MVSKRSIKVLSLGAGRQSSTILLMACYNEIERPDAAIFADTGWEPGPVYEWLEFLKEQGRKYGIPVYTVTKGNIRDDALVSRVRGTASEGRRWASMPLFVLGPDGKRGMIRRQCTEEYKVRPVERKSRELAGYKPRKRMPPGTVECWKGISMDEAKRASVSEKKWLTFYYPLIEMRMRTGDCLAWFKKRGLPEPPRSACVGCPYRHNKEWAWLRENSPEDFKDAVYVDGAIRRSGGLLGDVFLHADRIPLGEVVFSKNSNQMSLFGNECAGVCGV